MPDEPKTIKRRRRAPRNRIADGEMRNITFRVGSRAYNMLLDAADAGNCSISDLGETLIEKMLGDKAHEERKSQGPWSGFRPMTEGDLSTKTRRILDTLCFALKTYDDDKSGSTAEKKAVGAHFAAVAIIKNAIPLPSRLEKEAANPLTWAVSDLQPFATAGANLGAILWDPSNYVARGASERDILPHNPIK